MFRILFLLFITVPIIEIYLLIEVGSRIGTINTILIIILTAAIGTLMLRIQGITTIARVKQSLDQGKLPATELIEGLMLLVTGALLLTPGFFTDAIGFLCLIPVIRIPIAEYILRRLLQKRSSNNRHDDDVTIIEGEYWEQSEKSGDDRNRLP